MIFEVKSRVKELILQNKENEVKRNTSLHTAGVYMLYVDCFESDTIVPFYIGQTNDFQTRHKQHLTELMALNRFDRRCYEYAVLKDFYNGSIKSCKIFSYMVNHGCSLNDWHMIVLEEISDKEMRKKREQELIDQLFAPFFGFNQLNCILAGIDFCYDVITKDKLMKIQRDDAELLLRYAKYGYGQHNWYRVYEGLSNMLPDGAAICNELARVSDAGKALKELKSELSRMWSFREFGAEDKARAVSRKTIKSYFSEHNLKSKKMQELVVRVLLFGKTDERCKLDKYFSRTRLQTSKELFEVLWKKHGVVLDEILTELKHIEENYSQLEERETEMSRIVMQQLLPRAYASHPLGALELPDMVNEADVEENECHIHVEYTCLRSDYNHDFYPVVCKIDYCVRCNGEVNSRKVFISNPLDDFFERNDIYYCERGSRANPYRPYLWGNIDTHISVAMEYRNGINEHSFRDAEMEDLEKVWREINGLIDEKTKIKYTTSGYKSTIERIIDRPRLEKLLLSRKVRKLCR